MHNTLLNNSWPFPTSQPSITNKPEVTEPEKLPSGLKYIHRHSSSLAKRGSRWIGLTLAYSPHRYDNFIDVAVSYCSAKEGNFVRAMGREAADERYFNGEVTRLPVQRGEDYEQVLHYYADFLFQLIL